MVSVVLPSYNRAHLIRRAIASVLNQSYRALELIVVDDGSTDGTCKVVETLDDPRIQYIRHSRNRGAAAARNTGIEASESEYVAFQDSDDEWLPHKLERQMDVLTRSSPQIGVVYSSFWQVRGSGKRVYPPRSRRWASLIPSEVRRLEGDIRTALLRGNPVTTQAAVVRRACFERVGTFDERLPYLEDWELWLRISQRYRFAFVDDPLLIVYATPDSISGDPERLMKAFRLILDTHHGEIEGEHLLLAHYLHTMGDLSYRDGDLKEGRHSLFQAARLSGFNTLYWLKAFASWLGPRAYQAIQEV
jgi:glycosyltransferase involved in cell wall biosynthesis